MQYLVSEAVIQHMIVFFSNFQTVLYIDSFEPSDVN